MGSLHAEVARYVIANDRDAAMSGRWGGPELTSQDDPKPPFTAREKSAASVQVFGLFVRKRRRVYAICAGRLPFRLPLRLQLAFELV